MEHKNIKKISKDEKFNNFLCQLIEKGNRFERDTHKKKTGRSGDKTWKVKKRDVKITDKEGETDVVINPYIRRELYDEKYLEICRRKIEPYSMYIPQKSSQKGNKKTKYVKECYRLDGGAKYKNIVLSGGGVYGVCHIGVLQRLCDIGLVKLDELEAIAGTSAGAIVACLICAQFKIEEIWEFIKCIDTRKLVDPDIFMLFKDCGIETGKTLYYLLEDILSQKTGIAKITFRQLYEKSHIKFIAVGTCLTTKEIVYYDYERTPDFSVSMAVRISIGVPGIFIPVEIDGKKYIDGGILNNYAMNLFKGEEETTIGSLIYSDYKTDYRYPEEYFMAIINLFMHYFYNKKEEKYSKNTILVKKNEGEEQSFFNFDVSYEFKLSMYESGIQSVDDYLKRYHIS